jgi:hypothetical protein
MSECFADEMIEEMISNLEHLAACGNELVEECKDLRSESVRLKEDLEATIQNLNLARLSINKHANEVDRLEAALATIQPKWKYGKVPAEGWYVTQIRSCNGVWRPIRVELISAHVELANWFRWSGPILIPEEE